jgi:hypothetical protein
LIPHDGKLNKKFYDFLQKFDDILKTCDRVRILEARLNLCSDALVTYLFSYHPLFYPRHHLQAMSPDANAIHCTFAVEAL